MENIIKKGDLVEICIDKLTYGGDGIGKFKEITVFVPDTVPGDRVSVQITSVKKTYAFGIIKDIIEPSKFRQKPACGLAKVCGGCQWQHIDYEEQLRAKKIIIEENIKKIAHLDVEVKDVIKNENNFEYRCKIQYPVQQTKVSKRFLAGYYRKGSHEIVNIKHCPAQPEIIDKITQFIRENAQESELTAYHEKAGKGLIRHLVYRYSQSGKNLLLIIVINSEKMPPKLESLCKAVKNNFPEIAGVLINFNTANSNVILGYEMKLVCGKDFVEEKIEGKRFKISAESFFQVNPSMAVKMFNAVREMIRERIEKPTILDIYAGVGTFSIWLKDGASKITAIEESASAVSDARENIKLNKTADEAEITVIEGDADVVMKNLEENKEKFDVTILDPPRKGCSQAVLDSAINLTGKYIVYISCNPATLARDIKLLSHDFIPEYVRPVDMFSNTYHIESIALLKKLEH